MTINRHGISYQGNENVLEVNSSNTVHLCKYSKNQGIVPTKKGDFYGII